MAVGELGVPKSQAMRSGTIKLMSMLVQSILELSRLNNMRENKPVLSMGTCLYLHTTKQKDGSVCSGLNVCVAPSPNSY